MATQETSSESPRKYGIIPCGTRQLCLCNLQRALRLHRGAQLFETIQTVMIAELLLAAHIKQNGETIKAIHGIYCFTRKAQEAGDQEEKA